MLKSLFKVFTTLEKREESLTEIRVPLYKQIKTKTSQSLPADEKSMLQAIKCILYYLYY